MSVIKDGQEVSEVIIQEGVLTYERVNDAVAEPVVYMIDRYVVGGFYRVHAERGIDENLNAPGASFVPLAFAECTQLASAGRQAGRQRAEPLLHVRRDRPAGDAGGQLRARGDRPRRRGLRLSRCAGGPLLRCNIAASRLAQAHNSVPKLRNARSRSARPEPAAVSVTTSSEILQLAALTLGAIGVVYGDIGTSALYALKEVFATGHVPLTAGQRLRRAVAVLLDADGHRLDQVRGAGPARRQQRRGRPDRHAGAGLAGGARPAARCAGVLLVVGIFGTAIFFGDGVITPAISVLSARSRAWRSRRRAAQH